MLTIMQCGVFQFVLKTNQSNVQHLFNISTTTNIQIQTLPWNITLPFLNGSIMASIKQLTCSLYPFYRINNSVHVLVSVWFIHNIIFSIQQWLWFLHFFLFRTDCSWKKNRYKWRVRGVRHATKKTGRTGHVAGTHQANGALLCSIVTGNCSQPLSWLMLSGYGLL